MVCPACRFENVGFCATKNKNAPYLRYKIKKFIHIISYVFKRAAAVAASAPAAVGSAQGIATEIGAAGSGIAGTAAEAAETKNI